ncbi:MAG: ECF transporter S component [Firmicutes bacterium]|nr:ECF transporter S component [Bacillota bacterium]
MTHKRLVNLLLSAMFLALCLVLPFLTGQIPEIGAALSPMHIPVLICGFVCGWPYAALVGFIAPLLRTLLFGMPPFPTVAVPMAFELMAYGFFSGLIYQLLKKTTVNIYVSLIGAMLLGRVVWGVAKYIFALLTDSAFTLQMYLAGGFIEAVPALILHIALIPVIVIALKKAKLIPNE